MPGVLLKGARLGGELQFPILLERSCGSPLAGCCGRRVGYEHGSVKYPLCCSGALRAGCCAELTYCVQITDGGGEMGISKGSKPLMRGGAERGTRGVPPFPEARPPNCSVVTVLLSTEFSSKPCSGVTLRVQPIPRKPYCVHSRVIICSPVWTASRSFRRLPRVLMNHNRHGARGNRYPGAIK